MYCHARAGMGQPPSHFRHCSSRRMQHQSVYATAHAALCGLPLCLAAWGMAWGAAGEPRTGPSLAAAAAVGSPRHGAPPGRDAPAKGPLRHAKFGRETASAEVRHMARWVFHSGDHAGRSVVVVDKRQARVYVFDPQGTLQSAAPALLGSAIGDHTVPGVGNKPIAQVLPSERTTPAGRFVAEPGTNASGEDVVWVDYDAAVSMHRVRPLVKAERRLERLASSTPRDNRISYGCINLPVKFYENVLSPAVRRTGAVVYVLPETQPAARWFGLRDASTTKADQGPAAASRASAAGPVRHGLRPVDDARAAADL